MREAVQRYNLFSGGGPCLRAGDSECGIASRATTGRMKWCKLASEFRDRTASPATS